MALQAEKTPYNYSLDVLRALAAYLVVLLHVAAQAFYVFSPGWEIAVFYNSFGRVAVNCFFMISGTLFIPKNEPMKSWIKRLLKRTLIPYIVWSYIYVIYKAIIAGAAISFVNIFSEVTFYHLPFMLTYLSFQLALPLIRGFWNNINTSSREKLYVVAAALLSGCLIDFITPLTKGTVSLGFSISYIPYYAGLAMLGAYLKENAKKTNPWVFLLGCAVCQVTTAALTIWRSHMLGQPTDAFLIRSAPLNILGSICLYCFLNNIRAPERINKAAKKLASTSFFIYLAHPLVLDVLNILPIRICWNTFTPVIWIPVMACLVYVVCMVGALIMQRCKNHLIRFCKFSAGKESAKQGKKKAVSIETVLVIAAIIILLVSIGISLGGQETPSTEEKEPQDEIVEQEPTPSTPQATIVLSNIVGPDQLDPIVQTNIYHSIDICTVENDILQIKGWGLEVGTPSEQAAVLLAFTNLDGDCVIYDTSPYFFTYLRDVLENGEIYDTAFFECNIPASNFEPGTYTVELIVKGMATGKAEPAHTLVVKEDGSIEYIE